MSHRENRVATLGLLQLGGFVAGEGGERKLMAGGQPHDVAGRLDEHGRGRFLLHPHADRPVLVLEDFL